MVDAPTYPTLAITDSKKARDEDATLLDVRVDAIVMPLTFHLVDL
jgi:hypothetical protein